MPSTEVVSAFSAGQFARSSIDNTAFFNERPKGEAEANKLLSRGTSMKVISTTGSYVKVELDSGEIGYVPSVMLEDPKAVTTPPPSGPNEIQVYPPLNDFSEPLPFIAPPEEALPTLIDPEAPAVEEPKIESAPLPPNDEDLAAEKEETPKLE